MTNKEIALAALGKAQKNGFQIPYPFDQQVYWDDFKHHHTKVPLDLIGLFFSYEFAKYFWPDYPVYKVEAKEHLSGEIDCTWIIPNYKVHQFKMINSRDPLGYLEQFIS